MSESNDAQDVKLDALLKAYEVANDQHIHEHNRSLTKFNYFLVIELALLAALFSEIFFEWAPYAPYVICSSGVIYSVIWLISHQRGRACYETKLAYAEKVESKIASVTELSPEDFLFSDFAVHHESYASSVTQNWDTEIAIMWLIYLFIGAWIVLLIGFGFGVIGPDHVNELKAFPFTSF